MSSIGPLRNGRRLRTGFADCHHCMVHCVNSVIESEKKFGLLLLISIAAGRHFRIAPGVTRGALRGKLVQAGARLTKPAGRRISPGTRTWKCCEWRHHAMRQQARRTGWGRGRPPLFCRGPQLQGKEAGDCGKVLVFSEGYSTSASGSLRPLQAGQFSSVPMRRCNPVETSCPVGFW